MQLISMPIYIAERVVTELVVDWMHTNSVQNIESTFVRMLRVTSPIAWVIEWLNSVMPNRCTLSWLHIGHEPYDPWAIYDLYWTIPNAGQEKRISFSLETIITNPFQASTGYVKVTEWGQHCSTCRKRSLIRMSGTLCENGDLPNKNAEIFCRCPADIFSLIGNYEIQHPGMLIPRRFGQLSLARCTNDCHNCRSGRQLMLHILTPFSSVRLIVYLWIFTGSKVHHFKIEVWPK
jgi:hypothetical protein